MKNKQFKLGTLTKIKSFFDFVGNDFYNLLFEQQSIPALLTEKLKGEHCLSMFSLLLQIEPYFQVLQQYLDIILENLETAFEKKNVRSMFDKLNYHMQCTELFEQIMDTISQALIKMESENLLSDKEIEDIPSFQAQLEETFKNKQGISSSSSARSFT